MKTIGFTNVYYTLWEVGEVYAIPRYYNGMNIGNDYHQDFTYIQNLSKDLDRAKEKVTRLTDKFDIDLDLRGHSSFRAFVRSDVKDREHYYGEDCFSFGRMEGTRFEDATDVWQLKRAMREEKSPRRRVWARRRLIELGEIVRYSHVVSEFHTLNGIEQWIDVRYNYATLEEVARFEEEKKGGHHFRNGEKVELEVKKLRSFWFETMYGSSNVTVYITADDKIVKYVGSSPIESMDTEEPEWIRIRGTVKHTEYKGKPETRLQRIKQL